MILAAALMCLGLSVYGQPIDFHIAERTIQIVTNRPDLEVEEIGYSSICGKKSGTPLERCENFTINGSEPGTLIFAAIENGSIKIPKLTIHYSGNPDEFVCLGMKVFFKGIPNQTDYQIYLDPQDRYSILSFCSSADLPDWAKNPRWTHKKVNTFEKYLSVLSGPFLLHLMPNTLHD